MVDLDIISLFYTCHRQAILTRMTTRGVQKGGVLSARLGG